MKWLILPVILLFLGSCVPKDEKYYNLTDVIEIKNFSIPDSTGLLDTVRITVSSEEPNRCWYNLNFVLSKNDQFRYRLKAFGTFVNNGIICQADTVKGDTVINFIPIDTGTYLFYVNKTPADVIIDTLKVK